MSATALFAAALLAQGAPAATAADAGQDRVEVAYAELAAGRTADALARLRANPALVTDEPAALINLGAAQARMAQTGRLVAEASARQRIAYADQPRSLTSHAQGGADTRPHGVAVHDTQARFGSDGTLQAQGVYTQHDSRTSPVFVPLLVLTDAEGRQLAEASGKAERLEAGQSATFNLQLSASALPAGTYYASLIVSHPDTGKSIGQGQYHVAVRK